ncbi:MAG: DUF1015 domain-containing protein [Sedimentisphaerales bacterium]|nr:DUF1015 domain-containing protein [Sedimentisphaerales bacterium]
MQLQPFRAFRYNPAVVGDVAACIAAPYDVIDDNQQKQLYEKSPYNIVHITKGSTSPSDNDQNNRYTRAADYLNNWIEEGALRQDEEEAVYAYIQDFDVPDGEFAGQRLQRYNFIALARLEEFGKIVKPHEQILNGPLIDRLNLKQATEAEFGLVFMLFDDEQMLADAIIARIESEQTLIDFTDEQNTRHRLYAITDSDDIEQIENMMSDKSCIIADGHHRYTTGLNYSKTSSNPAAKYQMLAFSNIRQKGLIVLATHRLVGNLENFSFEKLLAELTVNFEITRLPFDTDKADAKQKMLATMMAEHDRDKNAFGIYAGDNAFYVAVLKDKNATDKVAPEMSRAWRTLDVSVLHKLILESALGIDEKAMAKGGNIKYIKGTSSAIDESIAEVDASRQQVAFFMNPVKMQQLINVTDAGERMPQKSTFFFPKVYSGLTIQKF